MLDDIYGTRIRLAFSILILCLAASSCSYNQTLKSNETALKQELRSMREALDQYTEDKRTAPQELNDLVAAGYIKSIPTDPFTHSNSTWIVVREDILGLAPPDPIGITDVHSGSHAISSDGTRYDSW